MTDATPNPLYNLECAPNTGSNRYPAMSERYRLTEELENARYENNLLAQKCREMEKERDEARRLLKAVVDMMHDNMVPDATHPKHLCDFIHRPDIAMCKVCEDWTDAMVMCYPDDFQDEEDEK